MYSQLIADENKWFITSQVKKIELFFMYRQSKIIFPEGKKMTKMMTFLKYERVQWLEIMTV